MKAALAEWAAGGWRRPGAPRTWDGRVYDLFEYYDACVAWRAGKPSPARRDIGQLKRTPAWRPFDQLLRFLDRRGIDPTLYLTAVFSTPWRGNACSYPYPSQLVCEASFGRWLRWSADVGRRYQYQSVEAAQSAASAAVEGPEAALRRVLDDGLAQYHRLVFKDVPRLVLLAPGALPPEFALAWPAVRRSVDTGAAPAEVAAAWARLKAAPPLVAYLDTWARAAGLPLE